MGFAPGRCVEETEHAHPVTLKRPGRVCTLILNGELYNAKELGRELKADTDRNEELFLLAYMQYGPEFVKKINGVFGAVIWDETKKILFLFRDRIGAKPMFYTQKKETLFFASAIGSLFQYPGVDPVLDENGLCEIFALGPARTPGNGVFRDIYEVLPGHYLSFADGILKDHCYWNVKSQPHEDSREETVEKTAWLLEDSIKRQMESEETISTFLSGGVDSSLVTAVCADALREKGERLQTFSFDFEGNRQYFQANAFQPSQDRPWVEQMVTYCGSEHRYLECSNEKLAEYLYKAVDARCLPCMADVESSMLYFCSQVSQYSKAALTGECADEIFGGYPWFHKKECLEAHTFPWTMDLAPRKAMLSDEFLEALKMDAYVQETYAKSVAETPRLAGESALETRRREISYLNQKWFMQTLLDRMGGTSARYGLSARVPFADYRIVEYLWNVPWEMKAKGGVVKGLLREAGRGLLPDDILFRKKSPYPKTYDKAYEAILVQKMRAIMAETDSPIRQFLDTKKVERFLSSPSDYGKPWYGQLMAAPQMIAYLIQVNYWLEKYHIKIEL